MAALATRLGATSLTGLTGLAATPKLLGVNSFNKKAQNANIYSKSSGMIEPRMKPWDYKNLGYGYWSGLYDGTTKRFNDNSKVIVIEGPPGLQKTKFAKELAEEFDMLYVPGASMEDYYINKYGYDLREVDHLFEYPENVSFDEKKFCQNPTGQHGGLDRMQDSLEAMRLRIYVDLLAHLFNTGQGVVTEKSPFSDYCWSEAAYKMGWIDRETRILFNKYRKQTLPPLLRPNLIIYLDAPVDVVQAKIRERAKTTHPWEANSPVFENTQYMTLLYEDYFKKDYIREAAIHSRVLMYDWSEGGETEVVAEDIERLNMDYFDKYDKQQKDWRLFKEQEYTAVRIMVTEKNFLLQNRSVGYLDADRILLRPEVVTDLMFHSYKVPGSMYPFGYNEELGESVALKLKGAPYAKEDVHYPLDPVVLDNDEWKEYWRLRQLKRAAGEEKWWQF